MIKRNESYFTIETTIHRNWTAERRQWRTIECTRKDKAFGYHVSLGLVFVTKKEREREIEKRINDLTKVHEYEM